MIGATLSVAAVQDRSIAPPWSDAWSVPSSVAGAEGAVGGNARIQRDPVKRDAGMICALEAIDKGTTLERDAPAIRFKFGLEWQLQNLRIVFL